MKKNDTIAVNVLIPKKQTIDFLLKFSKCIAVIEVGNRDHVVFKN